MNDKSFGVGVQLGDGYPEKQVPCGYCTAQVGQPCHGATGNWSRSHSSRLKAYNKLTHTTLHGL